MTRPAVSTVSTFTTTIVDVLRHSTAGTTKTATQPAATIKNGTRILAARRGSCQRVFGGSAFIREHPRPVKISARNEEVIDLMHKEKISGPLSSWARGPCGSVFWSISYLHQAAVSNLVDMCRKSRRIIRHGRVIQIIESFLTLRQISRTWFLRCRNPPWHTRCTLWEPNGRDQQDKGEIKI